MRDFPYYGRSAPASLPAPSSPAALVGRRLAASMAAILRQSFRIGRFVTAGMLVCMLPSPGQADTFCPTAKNMVLDSDFSGDWIARFGKGKYRPGFSGGSYVEKVQNGSNTCLRLYYKKGTGGSQNGMFFKSPLPPADGYRLEYSFKLKPGFVYNHTGKLFGFKAGTLRVGQPPSGRDFSMNLSTWGSTGGIDAFVYYPEQYMWGGYGDTFRYGYIPSGVLHTVRSDYIMNTPGQHNGVIKSWLNGRLGLSKENMRFRDIDSLKIDILNLDSFFGGAAQNQGPLRDEYIDFCRVRVCKLR